MTDIRYLLFLFYFTGREIDEYGNVVKSGAAQVKTLAANVAVERANKKKENPYLAHRVIPTAATAATAVQNSGLVSAGGTAGTASLGLNGVVPTAAVANLASAGAVEVVDERLPQLRRDLRARKALHFIEAGTLVDEAEKIKLKEERKIIAGYASGRKNIQHQKVRTKAHNHNNNTCCIFASLMYVLQYFQCLCNRLPGTQRGVQSRTRRLPLLVLLMQRTSLWLHPLQCLPILT